MTNQIKDAVVEETNPEMEKIKEVSILLEKFMIEQGVALQPVLLSNQFGIRPSVQLVLVPAQEKQEEAVSVSTEEEIEPEVITA